MPAGLALLWTSVVQPGVLRGALTRAESVFAVLAESSFASRGTHLLSSNSPPNAPRRPKGSLVTTAHQWWAQEPLLNTHLQTDVFPFSRIRSEVCKDHTHRSLTLYRCNPAKALFQFPVLCTSQWPAMTSCACSQVLWPSAIPSWL